MKNKIPAKKRFLYYSIISIFLLIVLVFVAEFSLRLLGHNPASPKFRPNIKVQPDGKYFKKDSVLGYTHFPGKFYVTLNDNYTFITTHKKNTHRITHPIADDSIYFAKPKIWIMGGSDTHGWSINDEEAYAWKVQERYNESHEVINFGASGYGTIHILLQIEEELKKSEKPETIVLAYGMVQDRRNTFLLRRRKAINSWNFLGPLSQPYATYSEKEGLLLHKADNIDYKGLPFNKYSSLVNFMEKVYLYFEDKFSNSHDVTKAIIIEIKKICDKNNIEFVVAGIDNTELTYDMIDFCKSNNIYSTDISVDFSIPGNVNLPHDAHPSPYANDQYSEKLCNYIDSIKK